MTVTSEFQKEVDVFLTDLFADTKPESKYRSKVIHDSVWGTNSFYAWEIALIDSPLLQRLRRIHQTGLAYLVYPTATHTRFEHSLGVTILVEKLINNLNLNHSKRLINDKERCHLRLAALLHDVGHSFLSHVSELVYERLTNFQQFKEEIIDKYHVSPKGHELMSFLIVNSPVFQQYYTPIIKSILELQENKEYLYLLKIDWEFISNSIIGYSSKPSKKFLSDIINGPIDCDKLDYFARDAKFSGARIVYDIDRYFYSVTTIISDKKRRLTLTIAGINVVEQFIISKMMMFSYVYHHHKVRAAEAFIKRLCFNIIESPNPKNKPSIKLKHPVDFLYCTDEIILNSLYKYYGNSNESKLIIKSILDRNIWIRAQMIACFNTTLTKIPVQILQLERELFHQKNIDILNSLKDEIIKEIKKIDPKSTISRRDFWIDVPFPPSANEAKLIEIKKSRYVEEEPLSLVNIFPLEQWIDAYERSKLKGHIFCEKKYQKIIFKASSTVLQNRYGFKFKEFTSDFIKVE
jgi:uncharacterized protein